MKKHATFSARDREARINAAMMLRRAASLRSLKFDSRAVPHKSKGRWVVSMGPALVFGHLGQRGAVELFKEYRCGPDYDYRQVLCTVAEVTGLPIGLVHDLDDAHIEKPKATPLRFANALEKSAERL